MTVEDGGRQESRDEVYHSVETEIAENDGVYVVRESARDDAIEPEDDIESINTI